MILANVNGAKIESFTQFLPFPDILDVEPPKFYISKSTARFMLANQSRYGRVLMEIVEIFKDTLTQLK